MDTLQIYQIDAFAARPFRGNPAAVCPLDRWPGDELMQAIAAENNLSETAFLVPRGTDFGLRWFTPTREVDLCGHATLASAWVVLHRLQPGRDRVTFHTRSGALAVEAAADGLLRMDFPELAMQPCEVPPGLSAALGCRPREVLAGMDYMAVLESERQVRELAPDLRALAGLDRRGLIVTAPGERADFVSRFFAPGAGIDEDPVTGSAHCALAPFWAGRLGRAGLEGQQVSARGGTVLCTVGSGRVTLAGRCAFFLQGEIRLP
ncbi:MAG TPA: PhzF family phenazine biosynthesis protein [Gammaproteobacteria bacterium]|nr:PhzF family phenazine biosynthesis protein [Gammaproteobacteria bacterium]